MWWFFILCFALVAHFSLSKFHKSIHLQIFSDFQSVAEPNINFDEFLAKSPIQAKFKNVNFLMFPLILACGFAVPSPVVVGFLLLIYLSFVDLNYFLVDLKALIAVFAVSLYLGFSQGNDFFAIFVMVAFFAFLHGIMSLLNKQWFGAGDSMVIVAIAPMANFSQILWFVFMASILGILFLLSFRFFNKKQLRKIAFVPFLTIAFWLCFILEVKPFLGWF